MQYCRRQLVHRNHPLIAGRWMGAYARCCITREHRRIRRGTACRFMVWSSPFRCRCVHGFRGGRRLAPRCCVLVYRRAIGPHLHEVQFLNCLRMQLVCGAGRRGACVFERCSLQRRILPRPGFRRRLRNGGGGVSGAIMLPGVRPPDQNASANQGGSGDAIQQECGLVRDIGQRGHRRQCRRPRTLTLLLGPPDRLQNVRHAYSLLSVTASRGTDGSAATLRCARVFQPTTPSGVSPCDS